MSYAIIRNVKHKMGSLGGIGKHNERENKNYGNPNIDHDRTSENFYLKEPTEDSYIAEFHKIKEEENLKGQLKLSGKKQSNVACEFIITSDSKFFENKSQEEIKKFFEDSYDYVKKKCGEKNVISATVHMDEKTPHMHAVYIPVIEEKNKKGEMVKKINCSKFWKPYNSYGQLQDEFHKHISEKGYDLQRGEVGTQREHIETSDFKKQTLLKEIQKLEKTKKVAGKQLNDLDVKLRSMDGVLLSRKKLDSIKPEQGLMGTVKNVTPEDIQSLKKTALEYHLINEKLKNLSNKYVAMKAKVPTLEDKKAEAKQFIRLEQLEKENARLAELLKAAGIELDLEKENRSNKQRGQER
ncbi:MAG: MobV family relaxase [Oscillospiraceae bacterium]